MSEFLWHVIVMLSQAAPSCLFLALFLNIRPAWRGFLVYLFCFVCLLWPLSIVLPYSQTFLFNAINCLLLALVARYCLKVTSWKRISLAICLYELGQVLSAFLSALVVWLFQVPAFNPGGFTIWLLPFYGICACILAIVYTLFLVLFPRRLPASRRLLLYLLSLLFNSVLLFMFGAGLMLPLTPVFFNNSYTLFASGLLVYNACILVSLYRFMKKEKARRSAELVEQMYRKQLNDFLREQSDEEQLRRFRHDLLNFLESDSCASGSADK